MGEMLFMLMPFLMFLGLIAVVYGILRAVRRRGDARSEYVYRKDKGHYYFDNGKLVINIPPVYRPWAVPVEEIGEVVVVYNTVSLGKNALGFDIIKKDGTVAKGPGFVVYTHRFSVEDTLADLRAHGIRCRTDKKSVGGKRAR